ncbi:MAG: ssDNA-binding protein [Lachnospiraceae bacterium]
MSNKTKANGNAVILDGVTMSFAHLFEKDTYGGNDCYDAAFLIDKNDETALNAIKKAIETAKKEGEARNWNGRTPGNIYLPLHDGDTEKDTVKYPEYRGKYYIKGKNAMQPPLVMDVKRGHIPLTEEDDGNVVYPGMKCAAGLSFHPYLFAGNAGIRCQLDSVLKTGDGPRLGGGPAINYDSAYDEWFKEAGTDDIRPEVDVIDDDDDNAEAKKARVEEYAGDSTNDDDYPF